MTHGTFPFSYSLNVLVHAFALTIEIKKKVTEVLVARAFVHLHVNLKQGVLEEDEI